MSQTEAAPERPPTIPQPVRVGPFVAGRDFEVITDDQGLADDLAASLVDLRAHDRQPHELVTFVVARTSPPSPTHPWEVWRDSEPCETVTEGYVRPYVLREVTRLLLENSCASTTPIHAGAVARDGSAIVIAGESEAGKSTLSGWLTAHGWDFLTDEVALLDRAPADAGWHVLPFPRPIGVRRPSPLDPFIPAAAEGEGESLIPASHLGRVGSQARLSAIVLPNRKDGIPGELTPVHPATAVRLLAGHLPLRASRGRPGFRDLIDLCASVPVLALGSADLTLADQTLRALVQDS